MDILVKTPYGTLAGTREKGFVSFLGVPYAAPPVGQLRFRRPQPVQPWEGIRPAKRYGDYCPQPGKRETLEKEALPSEDCLTLNIFTPGCDGKKRPVAIWIHGGAYMTGCASEASRQGGWLCRREDIVVVSIQYRLGAFGQVDFSCLSGARGRFDTNCGTWDQVAAVNWVRENIALFGGDPECITLMGESAGASSVLTLMTAPCLRGKIKGAVMESLPANLINTRENGRRAAMEVLRRLGLTEEEAWKAAELPAEILVDAVKETEDAWVDIRPYTIPTAPVVDADLIPKLPFDAVMDGAAKGIRVLMGTTRDEGTMFARGKKGDLFPTSREQFGKFAAAHPEADWEKILAHYDTEPEKRWAELGKEITFQLPTVALARRLSRDGQVYLYRFDHAFPMLRLLRLGAVHCSNSVLVFGGKREGYIKFLGLFSGMTGKRLSDQVHRSWAKFLAWGDPNCDAIPYWPPFGEEEHTFVFDKMCRVEKAASAQAESLFGLIRPWGN